MEFTRPDILLALLFVPPALLLAWWAAKRRREYANEWGEAARSAGAAIARRRVTRDLLLAAAFAGMIIAAAQPRGGAVSRIMHRQGSDVVFVLDLSKSMLARDVAPDRLQRAIFEIERLLDGLTDDRVGLVVFAGTAFVQAPLTVDKAVVRNFLHKLDPASMPYPGSNLSGGIERALELMKTSPSGGRAIVVLTDGEETTGRAEAAARRARELAVPVYVLAVGTARGEPIPVPQNEGGLLRDAAGKPVFSKLDEPGLRAVAKAAGGRYFRVGPGGDADAIETVLQQLQKRTLEERTVTERAELYPLALAPALLLFMVALWMHERYSL